MSFSLKTSVYSTFEIERLQTGTVQRAQTSFAPALHQVLHLQQPWQLMQQHSGMHGQAILKTP